MTNELKSSIAEYKRKAAIASEKLKLIRTGKWEKHKHGHDFSITVLQTGLDGAPTIKTIVPRDL